MKSTPSSMHWLVYATSGFAALAGLLFGYDTGIISGAILFIKKDFALTPLQIEMTISAVLFGAIIGSGFSGKLTDTFGRRLVLTGTALLFILGSLITAAAKDVHSLMIGRFLLGIAIGVGSFTAPLYLAEVAPQNIRGLLVSLNQLAITIGIVLAYVVNYSFSKSGNWSWMLGLGVVPGAILLLGIVFLPESPRWLILKGYKSKAHATLKRIRNGEDIEGEFSEIVKTIENEKKTQWTLIFSAKWLRPILLISLGLGIFQQVTGINIVIYYAPIIFQMTGFHEASTAILATFGIGIVNVLFTIIGLPLIDRWGRRPLLLWGISGMFISLAVIAVAVHFPTLSALRWIGFVCILTYIACFAMSLGPVMWVVISEIFPLSIRGIGTSIGVANSWLFNLIISSTFLSLIQGIGISQTFGLYAVFCIVGWFFIYYCVPETKNCSLESIEKNLRLGRSGRNLGIRIDEKVTSP